MCTCRGRKAPLEIEAAQHRLDHLRSFARKEAPHESRPHARLLRTNFPAPAHASQLARFAALTRCLPTPRAKLAGSSSGARDAFRATKILRRNGAEGQQL